MRHSIKPLQMISPTDGMAGHSRKASHEIRQASDTSKPIFYRFQKPVDHHYPAMIELFARAALLAGIPAFITMRSNGWLSLTSCISVALFCTAISWFFVWLALSGATGAVTVFMALSAAAGGTIFWLVGVLGNSALTKQRPND